MTQERHMDIPFVCSSFGRHSVFERTWRCQGSRLSQSHVGSWKGWHRGHCRVFSTATVLCHIETLLDLWKNIGEVMCVMEC
jgi:hypothetical protein